MITIDVSAAVHSRAGLGRYSERLALALAANHKGRIGLFYNQGADGRLPSALAGLPARSVRWGYKPWRMAVLLAHLGHGSFDRLVPGVELFHSTEHLLFPLRQTPTVLTVHDLIFKLFPDYHKSLNRWYLNWAMPIYCRRADRIIAVSQATKADIVQHYNIDPQKITVVYEAASEHFRPPGEQQIAAVRRRYELPQRFLLHLSTIEPRKNLQRLIDALLIVRRRYPQIKLLLVGSRGWLYDDLLARIEREALHDAVQFAGWVPDADLPAVIAAAEMAVQPSLYEGFGLPLLEAMACGQVVAASNSASHPEVGGEAALYFDPYSVEAIADAILQLLDSPDERQQRRRLGLQQAARFSWQGTAAATWQLYEQLL